MSNNNSTLISTYSRATGLKIEKPYVYQAPFTLPVEKYIVGNFSSGNPCKNYFAWQEVIDFIWPYLKERNIGVVQLGNADDPPIEQAIRLQGKTNIHQSAFIVKNALLHIGNDSMLMHVAGALGTHVCGLFGSTSVANHGPYWKTDNSILIESHRNGKLPSFSFNENPRTINLIKPEEVVDAIFKILKIEQKESIDSLFFGSKYGQRAVEVVPDCVIAADFIPDVPLNIRYDYCDNLQNLVNQLSIRKGLIITDKPIDVNILKALKQNVIGIAYEINDNHNPQFASDVRSAGIQIKLFTKWNEEKLNTIRLDYFDVGIIEKEKTYRKEDVERFAEINSFTMFKSRKVLLSKGKSFLSKTHFLLDIPMKSFSDCESLVIDVPKFYHELEHFYLYNKTKK